MENQHKNQTGIVFGCAIRNLRRKAAACKDEKEAKKYIKAARKLQTISISTPKRDI